ncbi:MAG: hypothetical protein PHX05_03145 [Acidobacteriota bacterium]|nr:hypothetical protein [Acidobacteriota bacterium]
MLRRAFSFYREAYSGLPRNAWLLSLVQFVNRSGGRRNGGDKKKGTNPCGSVP